MHRILAGSCALRAVGMRASLQYRTLQTHPHLDRSWLYPRIAFAVSCMPSVGRLRYQSHFLASKAVVPAVRATTSGDSGSDVPPTQKSVDASNTKKLSRKTSENAQPDHDPSVAVSSDETLHPVVTTSKRRTSRATSKVDVGQDRTAIIEQTDFIQNAAQEMAGTKSTRRKKSATSPIADMSFDTTDIPANGQLADMTGQSSKPRKSSSRKPTKKASVGGADATLVDSNVDRSVSTLSSGNAEALAFLAPKKTSRRKGMKVDDSNSFASLVASIEPVIPAKPAALTFDSSVSAPTTADTEPLVEKVAAIVDQLAGRGSSPPASERPFDKSPAPAARSRKSRSRRATGVPEPTAILSPEELIASDSMALPNIRATRNFSTAASKVVDSAELPTVQPDTNDSVLAPTATPKKATRSKRSKSSSKMTDSTNAVAAVTGAVEVPPPPVPAVPPGTATKTRTRRRRSVASRSKSPQLDAMTARQYARKQQYAGEITTFEDLLQDLPPVGHPAYDKRQWVVFSDLHVQEKSLDTCMQVLDRVLLEALARDAGVIFLGDFWHERGAVLFKILNPSLTKLKAFSDHKVPMLMLVGNHDQVDISGHQHGLSCLATDMIHVFTHPTVFRDVLWLPYRRYEDVLMTAQDIAMKHYKETGQNIQAIMAHADVATAKYNANYQARDGISPDKFPKDIPIYTGHYHMPHTVDNTTIQYIGSPYQVSASEVDQQKRLVVLDADQGWCVVEEIPIQYGYQHKVMSWSKTQPISSRELQDLGPHVRLRLLVQDEDQLSQQFIHMKQEIEATGAQLQLVHAGSPANQGSPRFQADTSSQEPLQLLDQFWQARQEAGAHMSNEALAVAKETLQDASTTRASPSRSAAHVNLCFESVKLEGFGPFITRTAYPLSSRGLRVVTGRNEDDAGTDSDVTLCSNGAGKSSLVSAALWALTGELTTRSESGTGKNSAVDAMLNDVSREAEVLVRGAVGGKPFVVERAVKKGATSRLLFSLDGEDLTAQDKMATQELIAQHLCTDLLRRQAFVGQNDVQALFEANDKQLKSELSNVIEMDIWDRAQEVLKPKIQHTKRELATLSGKMSVYVDTVAEAEQELQLAEDQLQVYVKEQERKKLDLLARQKDNAKAVVNSVTALKSQSTPFLEAWQRLVDLYDTVQQRYESHVTRGVDMPPQPDLPPAPTLQSTQELLIQQLRSSDAGGGAGQNGMRVDTSAEDSLTESVRSATEAEISRLKQAHEGLTQVERQQEMALEDKLQAAVRDLNWHIGVHGSRKQVVDATVKELAKRQRQLNSHAPGAACEACGQNVDRQHILKHINELQDKLDVAKRDLETAKQDVKNYDTVKDLAATALRQAMNDHKAAQELRQRQMLELTQAQAQREQEALNEQRRVQKQLQEAHAAREREHRSECDLITACWKRKVDAAQRSYNMVREQLQHLVAMLRSSNNQAVQTYYLLTSYQAAVKDAGLPRDLKDYLIDIPEDILTPAPGSRASPWNADEEHDLVDDITDSMHDLRGQTDKVARSAIQAVQQYKEMVPQLSRLSMDTVNDKTRMEGQITELQRKLKEKQERLSAAEASQLSLQQHQAALKEADKALGREGIQNYVLERVVAQLQATTDYYLRQLSDTLSLELRATRPSTRKIKSTISGGDLTSSSPDSISSDEDQDATSSSSVTKSVSKARQASIMAADKEQISKIIWYHPPDGSPRKQRDPAQLSGGERRRVALALLLGFSKLLRDTGRLTSNLFVLDEGLQQLDADGCRRVFEVLRGEPYETVLVVAQASSFVTLQEYDGLDVVVKSRGSAQLEEEA